MAEALPGSAPTAVSDSGAPSAEPKLVPVTPFFAVPKEKADLSSRVLEILREHSEWHKLMCELVAKHRMKVSVALEEGGKLAAAHLTLHNDFVLVRLGREHAFPRGFCVVVDLEKGRLVGQGTFYPKFQNDDRNEGFSTSDFGGVEKLSCFLKYSGSAGIVTVLRDQEGKVWGWTGSSKNSCNHGDPDGRSVSYPAEVAAVFGKYVSRDFLEWCQRWRVTSLGLEVFIADDQTHGYGYAKSGCIVTAICVEAEGDGRPRYLAPLELFEAAKEVGLPTDRPIIVEGESGVRDFIEALSHLRDLLALGALRRVLQQRCGITLETLHGELVDSDIVEGFVIRRWKGGVEVDSVKFKIWLYQMVTQVLRPNLQPEKSGGLPSLKTVGGKLRPEFRRAVEKEAQKWCVADDEASKALCLWVINVAAKACLPPGHAQLAWCKGQGDFPATAEIPSACVARQDLRSYWITLGDFAVKRLIEIMDKADWDVQRAQALLPKVPGS